MEQLDKNTSRSRKASQHLPKGCFGPDTEQKYALIRNYLQLKDLYTIATPFKGAFIGYVILKNKNSKEGDYLELFHEVSGKSLLKALPKTGQIGSKYLIVDSQSNKVVSRVRGDLLGNRFFIFDGGYNPNTKKFPTRKELAYAYTTNTEFFSQKPPSMSVILANHGKKSSSSELSSELEPLFEADGIVQIEATTSQLLKAQKENPKRVTTLNSVQPVYCPSKKGYAMDFKGLITQASPVNMVLRTRSNEECLVMGRRSPNTYSLFVGHPLTLVQAFGTFLANYIAKKQ